MTSKSAARRWAAFAFAALLALGAATASAIAGNYGQAAFSLALLLAFGGFLSFSNSEWAVAQSAAADERQRSLNEQALRYAYLAVISVAVAGFFTELARGRTGAFTLVCAVGGFTHGISLAILKRRR